ncbi:SPT16 [Enterospora canceri]|uniref:FACT complex subunit n=1 Tax=Enterospora canceri TaxID=1081671 RepID=A0A1Y1S7J4_9MICR|nr:SPT16 [Enterospora canceri]
MSTDVILNKDQFYRRAEKIRKHVSDPLVIMLGKRADVEEFALNSALFNYLLGFEFSETVIILKEVPVIFTSQKKAEILAQLGTNVTLVRNNSKENPLCHSQFISTLTENYSIVDRENIKGDFCSTILNGIRFKEVTEEILRIFTEKEEDEITNVLKAGTVCNNLIKKAIDMCRDEEFSKEAVERCMDSKIGGIDPTAIEFSYNPEHSSNGVRLGIRYRGYCAEIGRGFMDDFSAEYEIQKYAISLVRVGANSAEILQGARDFVEEKGLNLKIKMSTVGLMAKEMNFKSNFELKNNTVFVMRVGDWLTNTFILTDVVEYVTTKDSHMEYTLQRMKFRNKTNENEVRQRIKEHQKELLDNLITNMAEKYRKCDKEETETVSKVIRYPNDSAVPRNKHVKCDFDSLYVLVPILGYSIPFHISLIKNAAVSNETKLRINLKDSKDIKTLRGETKKWDTQFKSISVTIRNAEEVLAEINEMKRIYNRPFVPVNKQGALKERARKVFLYNLLVKTDHKIVSKKNIYNLELHENGFKYGDTHFLFSNIRCIFYQLGDFEKIPLIHFNLKEPIMLTDKPTYNLQFFKKQGLNYDDITKRENEHMAMIRQQEQEDELYRTNREFTNYIQQIESETSFRPQGLTKTFMGVYHKESASISMTSDALVSVHDTPYLVVYIDEIEIVNFERVTYVTKTFDCVMVFKDKKRQPLVLSAIETTKLNYIKAAFDSVNIVFMETRISINWNNLIATIMKDPLGFYESGGWTELLLDEPEEASSETESGTTISSSIESESESDDDDGISSDAFSESVDSDTVSSSSFIASDSEDYEEEKRRRR